MPASSRTDRLHRPVESLIQNLKKDKDYHLSDDLTDRELISVSLSRAIQVVRGTLLLPRLASAPFPLFVGKGVSVKHKHKVSLGRSAILDDYSLIDAMSSEGFVAGYGLSVGRGTQIRCSGIVARPGVGIKVGNSVGIAPGCFIGGQGGVTIEDDVIIGPGVLLISEDHVFESDAAIRTQGERRARIVVERGAWLGAKAIVLKGVKIGAGSVVAAGCVVIKNVPPRCVVAGVPGRVVREL